MAGTVGLRRKSQRISAFSAAFRFGKMDTSQDGETAQSVTAPPGAVHLCDQEVNGIIDVARGGVEALS